MPRYKYKAKTQEGKTIEAIAEASNEDVLERDLTRQGLILVSAVEADKKRQPRISLDLTNLTFFTMELGTSYSAGLPLLSTLEDMAEGAESKAVREVSRVIAERVSGGSSLHEALSQYPKAFPQLYTELVGAAERTGKLDVVLQDLVRFLEWQKETRSQIVGATVYPASMIGAVVMLTLVLTLFVFPRFLQTFAAMGRDNLPIPTRILLGLDETVGQYKGTLFLVIVGIVVGFSIAQRNPKVAWYLDYAKLRLPVIGPLLVKLMMSLFSHNLAMMLGSGLDFSTALRLCERILENKVFAGIVGDARLAVESGVPLSEAMNRDNLVPSLVRRMLKLGETTGHMEESLENVSKYYDKEIPRAIKKMFSILEPLILVVMAGVVLFMASAVLLPIYAMINKMGQV
jgi:type IV pilus assembly protein PilC